VSRDANLSHVISERFVINANRGRYYDHYFRRFLPIFSEKWAFFSKTNLLIFFSKTSSSLNKKANILAKFFSENILKIITSVPGHQF
jgi:hypothetical protein